MTETGAADHTAQSQGQVLSRAPSTQMGAQVEAARPHWSHVWLWPWLLVDRGQDGAGGASRPRHPSGRTRGPLQPL